MEFGSWANLVPYHCFHHLISDSSSYELMAWRIALMTFYPRIILYVRTVFPVGKMDTLCFEQRKCINFSSCLFFFCLFVLLKIEFGEEINIICLFLSCSSQGKYLAFCNQAYIQFRYWISPPFEIYKKKKQSQIE